MSGSRTPPLAVARAAARGLALRARFGRGGTAVGVARARDLSNRRAVSPRTLQRMRSFFARHAVDARAAGWGDAGNPSAGWIAWLLWGGDAGRAWAGGNVKRKNPGTRKGEAKPTVKYLGAAPYGSGKLDFQFRVGRVTVGVPAPAGTDPRALHARARKAAEGSGSWRRNPVEPLDASRFPSLMKQNPRKVKRNPLSRDEQILQAVVRAATDGHYEKARRMIDDIRGSYVRSLAFEELWARVPQGHALRSRGNPRSRR